MADKIIMEYTPPFRVELTYFKSSGKYYSEGSYLSEKLHLFDIFEEVKRMLAEENRPGLVSGPNEFYVLINVPNHPHAHPALIAPKMEDQDA